MAQEEQIPSTVSVEPTQQNLVEVEKVENKLSWATITASNGSTSSAKVASSSTAPAGPIKAPANAPKPSVDSKLLHLVVDSGALIKGANLLSLADNFWTTPDVIEEIRDKRARNLLQTLTFELKAREPSSEAMSAIVSFARKTGDFASLSLTDLRVMALTYMLEAETNGTEHLKQSPEASATITRGPNGKTVVSGEQSTVPCVYFGSVMGCKYGDECRFSHKVTEQPTKANESTSETVKPRKVAIACRYFNTNEGCKFGDECQFSHEAKEEENMKYEEEPEGALSPSDEEEREVKKEILQADIKSRILGGFGTQSNVGASEDDGKNWVTSDNLTKFLDSPFSDGKNVEQINGNITKVGCITTDYSMQNVMLQIGLNLLSTDGMVIRRVKQWILKCIACFTTTTEMERMFCPKCGNSTLERVSYSIGKDGKMVFYHRANRPVKLTGTKFSLPKPKGGRDGDLLLREDQLMMGIWGQRQRQRQQVMKSAFGENVAHDLGVKAERQTNIVVGYGRMNPNAQKGRERRGKKKKNSRH